MFLIAILYLAFAATFPLTKIILNHTDSVMFLMGTRMLIGGAILLVYRTIVGGTEQKMSRWDWLSITKNGVFGFFIAFALEFWALRYLPSIKVNLFYSFAPFVGAIMGYFFLQEKMYLKKWIGLAIGFAGMIAILLGEEGASVGGGFFSISMPELAILGGVVSATYAWFFVQNLARRGHSITFINGVSMVLAGAMFMITHYAVYPSNPMPVSNHNIFWSGVAALIVLANFIAFPLYGYLLKFYTVTFMSFAGFLCPLFGAIIGYLMLGETVTITMIIGFIAITIGLYLFYLEETTQK
ncbi:DMT family transporter [bacterium]|nr:DMT family transporter [bacterium]